MTRLTVTQRLSIVFAVLLLACSGTSVWLQLQTSERHEQAVAQQLSAGLAAHIASTAQLMDAEGWRPTAVRTLFDQLMAVNPSVEVYLLDNDGRIVGHAAPEGRLLRARVNLAPIHDLRAGAPLPIFGDDPRNLATQKVFSAAPVQLNAHEAGYVYVILQSEIHDALTHRLAGDSALRTTLGAMITVALLGLVMGLVAFRLITRPLRALTQAVRGFDANGELAAALPVEAPPGRQRDEFAVLRTAFAQMGQRIREQWRQLKQQDQQRREFVANISHDLRTPLTSLHGYLETLRLKDESLSQTDRQRYLNNALNQSSKVNRLAQELFELARLESGLVQPELEAFSLSDLIQDVLQKFELAVESRQQQVTADIAQSLPSVRADLGMIERVLTNLLDNAIRHNPEGTHVTVTACEYENRVLIEVADTGAGIASAQKDGLFTRVCALRRGNTARDSGGLGLIIVQRMLQLHGSEIALADTGSPGSVFRFSLSKQ